MGSGGGRPKKGDMNNPGFHHNDRLFNLLNHLSESPITGCNQSRVLTDGEETYEAMLNAMEKAKDHIHVEFYIFRHDRIGTKFQDVMIRKRRKASRYAWFVTGWAVINSRKHSFNGSKNREWSSISSCPQWSRCSAAESITGTTAKSLSWTARSVFWAALTSGTTTSANIRIWATGATRIWK